MFAVTPVGLVDPEWFGPGALRTVASWLAGEAPNPWSCAAMGEIASVLATCSVSKLSRPLPPEHVADLFGAP